MQSGCKHVQEPGPHVRAPWKPGRWKVADEVQDAGRAGRGPGRDTCDGLVAHSSLRSWASWLERLPYGNSGFTDRSRDPR